MTAFLFPNNETKNILKRAKTFRYFDPDNNVREGESTIIINNKLCCINRSRLVTPISKKIRIDWLGYIRIIWFRV